VDADMPEMAGFVSRHIEGRTQGDRITVLRNAITAPCSISQQSNMPVFLLLDDFDLADGIRLYKGGPAMLKEFMDILTTGCSSFLAVGFKKKIIEGRGSRCSIEAIELRGLEEETSETMMLEMCRQHKVECDTEILSLAARLLDGNPMYMKNIIWAAAKADKGLAGLRDFIYIYVTEVLEGDIAFMLRSAIALRGLDTLRVVHACANSEMGISEEELSERLSLDFEELKGVVDRLSEFGIIEINCGLVYWAGDNVVKDFIDYIYEKEVKGRSAEEAKTGILRSRLKEGFFLQGAKLEGKLNEEVSALLKTFNGQRILKALFRGEDSPERKQQEVKKKEGDEITLPHIVGRARFKGTRVFRWMVGRQGFAIEALDRLGQEGISSTDGVQLRILRDTITDKDAAVRTKQAGVPVPTKEFEIVLPMKSRSELVAARAVEEIGEEMGFDGHSIAQIKSALVEACINAFEHSNVKNGKVHVRFVSGEDRLAIHIQNIGSVFDKTPMPEPFSGTGPAMPLKRGWGIELMKRLMDDVRFEKLRGGTMLVMVKYLKKKNKRSGRS
jgi:serine/threonine-protein kinase RsbW